MKGRRRRSVTTSLIVGLLILSAGPLPGSPADSYTARRWRVEEGLPQDTVTSLVQAPGGRIWVGTRAGLASFDGVRFRVFDRRQLPELESSVITDLHLGRDGHLWAGTLGGGAVKLRIDGDVAVIDRIGTPQNLWSLRVVEILERPDGELWLGTLGSGRVVRSAEGRLQVIGPADGEPATVTAFEPGSEGAVWIGSDRGLLLHRDGRTVSRWTVEDGLPSPRIRDLARDEDDVLWLATDSGLASLDAGGTLRSHGVGTRGLPITAVHAGRAGEVWVGTADRGIFVSKDRPDAGGRRVFRPQQGPAAGDQAVEAFLQDEAGRLWYGTLGDGLNRLQRSLFSVYGPAQGLSSNIVTAVLGAGDGSVWVATRNAGLNRWQDGAIETFGPRQGLDAAGIWSMVPAPSGGLWIGTDGGGLYHLVDGEARRVPLPGLDDARIFALAAGSGGELWIGTNEGLVLWTDARIGEGEPTDLQRFDTADGLPGRQIRSLLFDRRSRLWVGTVDGLGLLDRGRDRTCRSFETIVDTVFGLYEDAHGAVWVGTFGSGVFRIEGPGIKDLQIRSLGTREGLFSDQIATIREDGLGYLWLGSPQGVVRIESRDLERSFRGESKHLPQLFWGRSDGLTGGGVWGAQQSSAVDTRGDLWLGTHRGVARLSPRDVRPRPAPEVTLDRVEVGGLRRRPSRLTVPASTRGYVIEYSVPVAFASEKIRIRYRLVGFDREWNDGTGSWRKTYTRLPPGRYTFEIQASEESGRFQGRPTAFSFRVKAGFTSSWWFWTLCGLAAILVTFGLHRRRIARLERRRQELASRVEEELGNVAVLAGLLPICGTCQKVRDDQGYWTQVEAFLDSNSEASFTHGLCPACVERAMQELEEFAPSAEAGR